MIVLLSLIVLLLIIVIAIIKQIAIIIAISNGMIMGTIVGGDKSFRRQKTEDKWGLLPSTPPLFVLYFYHILLMMWGGYVFDSYNWGYYLLVAVPYALDMIVVGGIYFF